MLVVVSARMISAVVIAVSIAGVDVAVSDDAGSDAGVGAGTGAGATAPALAVVPHAPASDTTAPDFTFTQYGSWVVSS